MSESLAYVAAGIVFLLGLSHMIPAKSVVAGFGSISDDNRHIITMEWAAEGLSFIFVAALIVAGTWSGETPQAAENRVLGQYRVPHDDWCMDQVSLSVGLAVDPI